MALKQQNLAGSQGVFHHSDLGAVGILEHFNHSMRSASKAAEVTGTPHWQQQAFGDPA